MFKDDKESEIDVKHFGAGSTVSGNYDDIYLVFEHSSGMVAVLDLKTMKVVGKPLKVKDVNYLTASEARDLVSSTVGNLLHWTYTDFELYPKGLKGIDAKLQNKLK